ncbi:TasA family protein [Ruania alba]|uniref:SipW-cognate class signal peptide n=1 Tax=Ruania alba TaxID=648782 RepID=A0A1H5N5D1_9MICO|nr:SipW-cognate class signal peptide [Ruania alba]
MRSTPRSDPRRRGRPVRAILTTTAMVAAGLVVGAAATGGTYAFWNDSVTADATNVNTGSIEMTLDEKTALTVDDLDFAGLYPGGSVVRSTPVTIANEGSVPLSVNWEGTTVESSNGDFASSAIVSLRPATGTTCTTTPRGTALPTTLSPLSLDPGETDELCLEVRLDESAPASVREATAVITLTLTGEQVRP